jgi:hypothetical protein
MVASWLAISGAARAMVARSSAGNGAGRVARRMVVSGLPGLLQRRPHMGAGEAWRPGHVENDLLPPRAQIDRRRQRAHRGGGDHHRPVEVGMHHVVMRDHHPEHAHLPAHRNHVHVRMARSDPPADDLKHRCQHVEVAERAVGDTAEHAEPGMHGGLHLAPERAIAGPVIDVLQHRDGGQVGVGGDIIVPVLPRRDRSRGRLLRADHAGAGEADDRREAAIDGDHRLDREPDRAPLGHHQFEAVADGRRVPLLEDLQIGAGERAFGHCWLLPDRRRSIASNRLPGNSRQPYAIRSFSFSPGCGGLPVVTAFA